MGKKILVIDDDADFRDAMSNLLTSRGYEVLTAENGQMGFASAAQNKPDLILLDVMMTHRTEGFDLAQKFKTNVSTQNIPVVILTGICKDTNVLFKYEPDEVWLPVKEVLEKPVKPEKLLKTIEKYTA
jgi:CheY-like chemotaxis protein